MLREPGGLKSPCAAPLPSCSLLVVYRSVWRSRHCFLLLMTTCLSEIIKLYLLTFSITLNLGRRRKRTGQNQTFYNVIVWQWRVQTDCLESRAEDVTSIRCWHRLRWHSSLLYCVGSTRLDGPALPPAAGKKLHPHRLKTTSVCHSIPRDWSFRSVKIQMQQIHVNMYCIYLTSDLSVCKRHSTGACFLITYDSLEIPNQGPSKGSHENTKGSWDYYML